MPSIASALVVSYRTLSSAPASEVMPVITLDEEAGGGGAGTGRVQAQTFGPSTGTEGKGCRDTFGYRHDV